MRCGLSGDEEERKETFAVRKDAGACGEEINHTMIIGRVWIYR